MKAPDKFAPGQLWLEKANGILLVSKKYASENLHLVCLGGRLHSHVWHVPPGGSPNSFGMKFLGTMPDMLEIYEKTQKDSA